MEVKPGYKQTEVGVIPKDWDAVSIEAVTTRVGDGLHGTPIYSPNGRCFFINGNNLIAGKIVITADTQTVDHSEFTKHRKPLTDQSILMSINGTIGNLGLFDGEHVVLGKSVAYLNVKSGISKQFVYQSLHTHCVRQQFFDGLTGSTIGNLGLAAIRRTHIPLPDSESEQQAIAKALSDMDALLASLERLIAKKRDIKLASMQQLLSGQTRLPGFQDEWRKCSLGSLGVFLKGSGVKKDEAQSGELPCVRYGEIYTHHHDVVRIFNSFISNKVASEATPLRKGDLLFTASGETKEEIGKAVAFVADHAAFAGGDILILRPEASDSIFLGYYLNSTPIQKQKASRGQGDAVVHIGARTLATIELSIPPLPEQTAIATVLSDMDTDLSVLEQRLAKTRDLKQGMMQELLTGRTRLI